MLALLLASLLTLVELNCENLFDTRHDSLKQDEEFLPTGMRHWRPTRYWHKLNHIGQEIVASGEHGNTQRTSTSLAFPANNWQLPSLAVLCEVENDSVLYDLTHRSVLRTAGYNYIMTHSADLRGIDVALLYDPFVFRLLHRQDLDVPLLPGMRPTRQVLYACGISIGTADTLHLIAVHAPSRAGGEKATRAFRLQVTHRVIEVTDSILHRQPSALIIVAGDLNDYAEAPALDTLVHHGLHHISYGAVGSHGAKGTYRYRGQWGSLDHILCSPAMATKLIDCYIIDHPFLLEPDEKYGGQRPMRCYYGGKYQNGYSDHLPLVARFKMQP